MRRLSIVVATAIAIVAAALVLWRTTGPAMLGQFVSVLSSDELYPPAPTMPATVPTPVEDLLAEYEAFLRSDCPTVFTALQPGLSDARIDELEQSHGLKLTDDLRALYKWHNGTPRSANVDAFPNHEFIPFDVALTNRTLHGQQVAAESAQRQQVHAAFAGHRDDWVDVIVDLAGDGYFFDPGRSESQGSFFFCFAEDGSYMFYPQFRNYLAAIVEGQKSGVFNVGARGVDTSDFEKAHQLMRRFGAAAPR